MITRTFDGRAADFLVGPRFVGIDVGAETLKVVELRRVSPDRAGAADVLHWTRRVVVAHEQDPANCLRRVLAAWDWPGVAGAAVSGRLARHVALPVVPTKQAQIGGTRFLLGAEPITVAAIGSHGFSILELRGNGVDVFRENSRCSQGTGNFLRQLVGRFSLTIEEAGALCAGVTEPAVLSGRCPVILKTDMTHLANKGEDRARILAGLFDAVCENVLVLIKPEVCPRRVALIGGVARIRRVGTTFQQKLAALGLEWVPVAPDDGVYVEALGCALHAAEGAAEGVPSIERLLQRPTTAAFEMLPPLANWRERVRRMPPPPPAAPGSGPVILGFDIGSTGSKAVAIDASSRAMVWQAYRATRGDPVGAAQALLREFLGSSVSHRPVHRFGATGSGREIVGSLLTACYGAESVFVLNEIAAHAAGACACNPRVDTIFEIGGQDAKYIRLAGGRVIDCAMNEACSAGTGSFIEEQGGKFAGIRDVVHLSEEAIAATAGVSLGQHCSVFMAEVIDEAVAAGIDRRPLIAGLYDSIIQNYLNRVKGSRSVGQVIFCQGMPFASDALAAAVARQTGAEVIVPPNPGTVGALGIALLAQQELSTAMAAAIEPVRFLEARVEAKDTFNCRATTGCGAPGNRCRIERLRTVIAGRAFSFTWGGGCALHDKATRRRKLPDRAPDPFREREELVASVLPTRTTRPGARRIAITDEFVLKGLLPFFATFLRELGWEVILAERGSQPDLKRGIRGANVGFCAPMQLYHGIAARLLTTETDHVFLPMLRSVAPVGGASHAVACPVVQASPDILRWDFAAQRHATIVAPVINFGAAGLESAEFLESCAALAHQLGAVDGTWRPPFAAACAVQRRFEAGCRELGRRALEYSAERGITPVIVAGRPYTIYNPVLNSNVPAILREQGAIGIPLDCYPVAGDTPVFHDMYWGYGQQILRATHQVRRTPGHYSVYCSNYACGPDSFNLHFFAHAMEGKPFAIIETDGHSGDAGTKTRLEAFLHCVEQDRRAKAPAAMPHDFSQVQTTTIALRHLLARRERMLIPWMSNASAAVAACFRGRGIAAESLPPPDRDALRRGRRYTSGKECLPIALTLGSLLQRLDAAGPDDRFVYLMTSTYGPCRFGVYNLLNQIVLNRIGWRDRVQIWSPRDEGYFDEFPPAFGMITLAGLIAADLLNEAMLAFRSDEIEPGTVDELYRASQARLLALLETRTAESLSTPAALWQVTSGELFGIRQLLRETSRELARGCRFRLAPTVVLVGEIYVRSVPFANGFVAEQLQARGLRVHLAPIHEWLDYCDHMTRRAQPWYDFGGKLTLQIKSRIRAAACRAVGTPLGWTDPHAAPELLAAAGRYLSDELEGEAVLTLGGPILGWRAGDIDGVVSVGPHECMPNKIAESQFFHVAEQEGLPSFTVPVNGDPLDSALLDNFAFEVHSRFARQQADLGAPDTKQPMPAHTRITAPAARKLGVQNLKP